MDYRAAIETVGLVVDAAGVTVIVVAIGGPASILFAH
jgi:hypothetical protein